MDRYQRVEKPRNETPIRENEIRITALGRMRNYIGYGMSLLEENGHDEITIKAMGRAINKTVMVAELIKRRVAGLHQNTSIESVGITDTWEPLEEGLVPARDNSSCINDYPNIVQGTIGYIISRVPATHTS
ncbi:unnamed protein product [Triticum turgidum subsp. durum]|uniref:DNA/RNA-binding protein Alba-like domain-containing protein n=1 Tax=Triticum turgidum subsp. durum TaxID=4567 RepID=A0A9R0SZ52_TRITD|nr:unnamed protein product [Triticum turgidum subsp. durum]